MRNPKALLPRMNSRPAQSCRRDDAELVEEAAMTLVRIAADGHDLVAAEHEAQGDEDAAAGDERDHVGDAGHQVAAQADPEVALLGLGGHPTATGRRTGADGRDHAGRDGRDRLVDQALGVVDGPLDADVHGGLAGEPTDVTDLDVVGEDHAVGRGDHRRVELGEAARALGLDR